MFSVTYGTGEIKGELISDEVNIGGLSVEGQVFGAVVDEEGDAFIGVIFRIKKAPFSGILGLGFPQIAAAHTVPIFDNMVLQKKLKHNIFSLFLAEVSIFSYKGRRCLWRRNCVWWS